MAVAASGLRSGLSTGAAVLGRAESHAVTKQRVLPFGRGTPAVVSPFRVGLLKWVGSKQRSAHRIASHFPADIQVYREPFAGSAAVLATLAPDRGVASDAFAPLMEIWKAFGADAEILKLWYAERWLFLRDGEKVTQYEKIKASYNRRPNGPDLLFLCRSCYGGVIRFRKKMATCPRRAAPMIRFIPGSSVKGLISGRSEHPVRASHAWISRKPCRKQVREIWFTVTRPTAVPKGFCMAPSPSL